MNASLRHGVDPAEMRHNHDIIHHGHCISASRILVHGKSASSAESKTNKRQRYNPYVIATVGTFRQSLSLPQTRLGGCFWIKLRTVVSSGSTHRYVGVRFAYFPEKHLLLLAEFHGGGIRNQRKPQRYVQNYARQIVTVPLKCLSVHST